MSPQPRVLIIDDNDGIRHVCERILLDFQTSTASNGAEAFPIICSQKFDVILSDVTMPVMGGEELFRRVQRVNPSQASRMLFMTGDQILNKNFLDQFSFFVSKPFNATELLLAIKRVLTYE